MKALNAVLTLINILIVLGPFIGLLIIYRENLAGLILPTEADILAKELTAAAETLQTLRMESFTYNWTARTINLTFSLTNLLGVNLTLNSLETDIQCAVDKTILAHAALKYPLQLKSGEKCI